MALEVVRKFDLTHESIPEGLTPYFTPADMRCICRVSHAVRQAFSFALGFFEELEFTQKNISDAQCILLRGSRDEGHSFSPSLRRVSSTMWSVGSPGKVVGVNKRPTVLFTQLDKENGQKVSMMRFGSRRQVRVVTVEDPEVLCKEKNINFESLSRELAKNSLRQEGAYSPLLDKF